MSKITNVRLPNANALTFDPQQFNQLVRSLEQIILQLNSTYTPVTTEDKDQAQSWFFSGQNAVSGQDFDSLQAQINAVNAAKVNRSGDTMTGPLTTTGITSPVGDINTLAVSTLLGNSILPNGSSLRALDPGALCAPGMVVQVARHEWNQEAANASTTVWLSDINSFVTFTPLFASSKILVMGNISLSATVTGATTGAAVRLIRDSSAIGFTPGNFQIYTSIGAGTSVDILQMVPITAYIDAGNTNLTTFGVELIANTGTARTNRGSLYQSTLTIMEITT
jgi:hypothetical protein